MLITFDFPVKFVHIFNGSLGIFFNLLFEITSLINFGTVEKLTEEEITNFIINFKIDIWIGFFDSFDLFYQFINKKCQG